MPKRLKRLLYLLAGGALLLVALAFLALVLVNSRPVREALLARVNSQLNGQLSIQAHALALAGGRLELEGVELRDSAGGMLVRVERFTAAWRWLALLDRTLYLERVHVEKPFVDLKVDGEGRLNLLALVPPSTADAAEDQADAAADTGRPAFNLTVSDLQLSGAALHLDHRPADLRAQLTGLALSAAGDLLERRAALTVDLAETALDTAGIRTVIRPLGLKAAFRDDVLRLETLHLATAQTRLAANGEIRQIGGQMALDLQADLRGELAEWAPLLSAERPSSGRFHLNLTATGPLDDPDLQAETTLGEGQLAGVAIGAGRLALSLAERQLRIAPLMLRLGDGELRLQGGADLRSVWPEGFVSSAPQLHALSYHVELGGQGLSLAHIPTLPEGYAGRVGIDVRLSGQGVAPHRAAEGQEATTTAAAPPRRGGGRVDLEARLSLADGQTPVAGTPTTLNLTTRLQLAQGRVTVDALDLDAPQAEGHLQGWFELASQRLSAEASLTAEDLGRLTALAGLDHLAGRLRGHLVVDGTLARPEARFDLNGAGLAVQDLTVGQVDARGAITAGTARLHELSLQNGDSRLHLRGEAELYDPASFEPLADPRFDLTLEAPVLVLSDYLPQVQGRLALAGRLTGRRSAPQADLRIEGREIVAAGQPLTALEADLHFGERRLQIRQLLLALAADAQITGSGWADLERNYELRLAGTGIPLKRIAALASQQAVDGVLSIDLAGAGHADDPRLQGDLRLTEMVLNGQPIDDGRLRLTVAGGEARVQGGLGLDMEGRYTWADGAFDLDLLCEQTALAPYLAAAGLADLQGRIDGRVSASGNVRQPEAVSAQFDLANFELTHKERPLIAAEVIKATFRDRVLELDPTRLRLLTQGRLEASGSVALDGPLDLRVDGQVPLAVANPFLGAESDLQGRADVRLALGGTAATPEIDAEVVVDRVAMTLPVTFQKLHQLQGRLRYQGRRILVEGLDGKIDDGRFRLDGDLEIEGQALGRADLSLQARALPVSLPETLDLKLDGDLRLTGDTSAARLQGEVLLLEGLYYKDVKLNLLRAATARRRAQSPQVAPTPNPLLEAVALDIRVGYRQPFDVDNNLASLQVVPDLQVGGTLAQPVLAGRAAVTGGELTYQRKTFTVTRGVVDFLNPYRIAPEVDLVGTTQVRDWEITLTVGGTPEALTFRLTSDPEEEDNDIISLLLLGRTSRELIEGEGGATQSTRQMLAGLVASTMGEDIKRVAGVDIFEVDTANPEDDPESDRIQVTLGKKLSRRITVKYALESKQGAFTRRVISEYKFIDQLLMTGFQDSAGVFGGELVFRLEFR